MNGVRRLRDAGAGDHGSVAAELALALPAVVLVMLLGVGALGASARQVSLQDAAADAARLLGRGEDGGAAEAVVRAAVPGASMSSSARDDLICVEASVLVAIGVVRVPLAAASCALDGGR